MIPKETKPIIAVIACWTGSPDQDQKVAGMLNALGPVVGQALWRMADLGDVTLFVGGWHDPGASLRVLEYRFS